MLHLFKRGQIYYYDFTLNGKRYKGTTRANNKDLALLYAKQKFEDIYNRKYNLKPIIEQIKIEEFIKKHIDLKSPYYSQSWKRDKVYLLGKFIEFAKVNNLIYLSDIKTIHLEQYKNMLLDRIKLNSVPTYINTVKSMLNHAVILNYISASPAKQLSSIPTTRNKKRFLNSNEIQIICDALNKTPIYTIIMTALFTGMRRKELVNLEYSDIDYERRLIYVRNKNLTTKNKQERVIPLHESLLPIFNKKIQKGYCFKYNGKPFLCDFLTKKFKKLTKKLGLQDISLHTLRHTFISYSLMQGINIWEVGKWVGHSTSHMTEQYGHLCLERREIEKLNYTTMPGKEKN